MEETGLTDHEGPCPGHLLGHEPGGGQGTGVKMLLVNIQTHVGQLLLKLTRGLAGAVGQEEELLPLPLEPCHELVDTGQDAVAMVDDTVHIADEAFLIS